MRIDIMSGCTQVKRTTARYAGLHRGFRPTYLSQKASAQVGRLRQPGGVERRSKAFSALISGFLDVHSLPERDELPAD